jgi:DNA-binding transcriptional ArsR family regulator
VLRDAGLVHVREDGQRRLYSLEPAPLAELSIWLENRLDALDTEIRRRRRKR